MSKKKLTEQDKKDWTEFVEDNSKVPDKDLFEKKDDKKKYKFKFDFHGYSISQANEKIYEIINDCIIKNISEITNLKIIGLNYKDKKDNAEKFLEELGNPYDIILKDEDGTKSIFLGAYGVPETFIIDEELNILRKY